ncbi:MAG: 4-alpha-glucanotransferase, partial [Acidobacteriaceae bacterium]|nr:4-alpha-glucanotransferase [Acidobacteriaceae bacterium]
MATLKSKPKDLRRTNAWGVDLNYEDAFGKWHEAEEKTIRAVLQAMDAGDQEPPQAEEDSLVMVRKGERRRLERPALITLEEGETVEARRQLPADLPAGYHTLQFDNEQKARQLIVSPGRCFLPENLKTWGWAVQLYAARSRESWGLGDFGALEKLARWASGELGAGMMLLNPLSAAIPVTTQQASPYYPASRRFFNPLWIHVEWMPGAGGGRADLESLAQAGRALNQVRLIDRDEVFRLKMRAFELLWKDFDGDISFTTFCR